MKADFAKGRAEAEKAGLLGGSAIFKVKEGKNKIRLMSECLPHADTYKGTRNFKWLCYVIDRFDGKVKAYFMPHTIYKQLEVFQTDEDHHFEDVPMPYDITINAKNAGTKEVEYTVLPGREAPITALEHQEFTAAKPIKQLQAELKDKKEAEQKATPADDEMDTRFDPADLETELR